MSVFRIDMFSPADHIGSLASLGDSLVKGLGTGLLSNQGEQSINFYFIRVPLRKRY